MSSTAGLRASHLACVSLVSPLGPCPAAAPPVTPGANPSLPFLGLGTVFLWLCDLTPHRPLVRLPTALLIALRPRLQGARPVQALAARNPVGLPLCRGCWSEAREAPPPLCLLWVPFPAELTPWEQRRPRKKGSSGNLGPAALTTHGSPKWDLGETEPGLSQSLADCLDEALRMLPSLFCGLRVPPSLATWTLDRPRINALWSWQSSCLGSTWPWRPLPGLLASMPGETAIL